MTRAESIQAGVAIGGPDYAPLTEATIRAFLAEDAGAASRLGGAPTDWRVREIGDGNLNLVFIVEGSAGGLVVKQALPYVRLVGESWPLPLTRAFFEHEALTRQSCHVPRLVPRVHRFDAGRAAIVMDYLSPHIVLRKSLIAGTAHPRVARDLGTFAAETLFHSSDLALPAAEKHAMQALFSHNAALCAITEDLVFTDPYRVAPLNRWTSPQLDDIAASFRADAPLKVAVQELKWKFLSQGEALLHGDLHTGSVMVTGDDTRVIDPEFAFVGPIGFDTGAIVANFLLSFFSQDGHATRSDDRVAFRGWLLDAAREIWRVFAARFLALWRSAATGDAFVAGLFADDAGARALEDYRGATMRRLFRETLGFAGAKMARRILGLAHVADFETIADPDRRATCERKALVLSRHLMLNAATIPDMAAVARLARDARAEAA
jgi:5-methylthioribose kinase